MAQVIALHENRQPASGPIFAQIGRDIVPIIDISVAGVRVSRPYGWKSGRNIHFRIVPQVGAVLDFAHAVPIRGHVVGEGSDHLRIAFAAVTQPLALIIQAHAGADGGYGWERPVICGHPA